MVTITIRNLSQDIVDNLKAMAVRNGRSMEREAREILAHRLTPRERLLDGIEARWASLPPTTAEDVREWAESARQGRK